MRYFLDTNTIIHLLQGNKGISNKLHKAEFIACSVITELEYMAFPEISQHDINLFRTLLTRIKIVDVVHTDEKLIQHIIALRKTRKLKLPDAIIVGCSGYYDCQLITADRKILEISGIRASSYELLSG